MNNPYAPRDLRPDLELLRAGAADVRLRGNRDPRLPPTGWRLVARAVWILAAMLSVVGLLALGFAIANSVGSVDPQKPEGAVGAYLEALARPDAELAASLLCDYQGEQLIQNGFLETTRDSFVRGVAMPRPLELDSAGRFPRAYAVDVIDASSESTGWFLVVWEPEVEEYRVCGFQRLDD